MDPSPAIAIHVASALGALVLGPVALWARRAGAARPRLHRAAGYAWVTLMIATAVSAIFIRSGAGPNIAGFSPIHLLIPVTLGMLVLAFVALARGRISLHRKTMKGLYIAACLIAGFFTMLPNRMIGRFLGITSGSQLLAMLAVAALGYAAWRLLRNRGTLAA
ncbi:DUF2306 domain-containing protein [Ramlibacter sp.]|uniref:DUF2306 domain-containing protein n=1 Tax=Ramlibacter sp. TaxID=1917967 RepID=UPI003D11499D